MKESLRSSPSDLPTDTWQHLKQAIATSSGFQRWRATLTTGRAAGDRSLDEQVRLYLRETLDTLAY